MGDYVKSGITTSTVKVECRDGSVSYVSRYSMNKKEAKP